MPKRPYKQNGRIYCEQYACLSNTGIENGKISYGNEGFCKFENPMVIDFGNDVWGCEDERYPNDIKKPEIVCLCGSTRYFKTFEEQNFKLTLEGKIVLSIGCNTKSDEGLKLTTDDKIRLDELHKRKIDLCDTVLVLNVDGYIGDSTRSEIAYAHKISKPVKYLFEDYLPDYHPGD